MKTKKIFYVMIFINVIFCLSINKVVATNELNLSCTYENVDNKDYKVSTLIVSTNQTTPELSLDGYPREYILYGNNNGIAGSIPIKWFNNDIPTAYDYVQENGGKKCPNYFYIYLNDYLYYGFFSDKSFNSNKPRDIQQSFKLSEDSNVKEDEDGERIPVADKFTCSLKSKAFNSIGEVEINVTITYDDYKNVTFGGAVSYFDDTNDHTNAKKYAEEFDYTKKDVCPTDLFYCVNNSAPDNTYIMSKTLSEKNPQFTCTPFVPTDKKIENGNNDCDIFSKMELKYKSSYHEGKYGESKQALSTLKSFCKIILANQNYDDNEFSCINLCLNMNKHLLNEDLPQTGECGFSDRLTGFILNITKWLKYIIPVILIVLSILDFIKAMGSDKDEEMKKAQNRFVKRLIAAGLIFIIPLIIEFVLDKMGFVEHIRGCGIINF